MSKLTKKQKAYVKGLMRDPEFVLYLGGKRGKKNIPASSINRWYKQEVDPNLIGYNVDRRRGVWKGQPEATQMLSYVGPSSHKKRVRKIGESYRKRFKQESVLMVERPISTTFIGS